MTTGLVEPIDAVEDLVGMTEIRPSKIHGKGVFAVTGFRKDTCIVIPRGDDPTFSDATATGGMNHSDNPTCRIEIWGGKRYAVVFIADIPADEELTFDYWEEIHGK